MITEFQGQYRFLSNFWIEPDGTCVEIEYQAAKFSDPADRAKFTGLTPGQAKRLGGPKGRVHVNGNIVTVSSYRSDWDSIPSAYGEIANKLPLKVIFMRELVRQKFLDHDSLREKLLITYDQHIIEGNNHGDTYWGHSPVGSGNGLNHLGRILMQVREELLGYYTDALMAG